MIFAAGPLVGFWIGSWVDKRFQTDPAGKVILALLGFAAGVKQVVRILRTWIKESENGKD